MANDFNKTPPSDYDEDTRQKKRIPVYILILVGIFLLALLFYMFADLKPKSSEAPPGHPSQQTESTTTPAPQGDEATATDTAGGMDTATATDSASPSQGSGQ